jgi:hypothetical protein
VGGRENKEGREGRRKKTVKLLDVKKNDNLEVKTDATISRVKTRNFKDGQTNQYEMNEICKNTHWKKHKMENWNWNKRGNGRIT